MTTTANPVKVEVESQVAQPLVRLRNLSRSFGPVMAVRPLDLDIESGDFFAILGPSGCGKTTLLRMIGGFVAPSIGTIEIDGIDVTRLGPERRPTNMVFQGYGLFPHMNVRQNIGYGLRLAKRPAVEIARRVDEAIHLVRLEDLADREIDQLSGGQQQRVALARVLVLRPRVLLLDEPLAALDLKLRQAMQVELRRIHREIGGTFVFVTHDQGEALGLANRIAVMDAGSLVQVGDAEEIYLRPSTRFVSTFIGEANVLTGNRRAGEINLRAGPRFPLPGPDGSILVVLRPETLRLGEKDNPGDLRVQGVLEDVVFLGAFAKYRVILGTGEALNVHSGDPRLRRELSVGDPVTIGWSPEDQHVLTD